MTRSRPWTQDEVDQTVADYFDMLHCEIAGRSYSKAAHRRALARHLNARSEGAIEKKHQNISAILEEMGCQFIRGYKPLRNYQQLLKDTVKRAVESTALQPSGASRAASGKA